MILPRARCPTCRRRGCQRWHVPRALTRWLTLLPAGEELIRLWEWAARKCR